MVRESAAALLVSGQANGLTGAVYGTHSRFVWHEAPVMYRLTSLGDLAALRPVPWYATVLFYLLVAVVAAMVGLLRQSLQGWVRRQPRPR